jgi:hypothetical protein
MAGGGPAWLVGDMPSLTSLVGLATAAGSAALVVAPRIFIGLGRLADTPDTRTLVRAMGARDVGIGLVMLAAPSARARRLATTARVVGDWTDAVVFPATLSGRGTAGRVSGFAAAWGALSLGALVLDERAGR